MDGGVTDNQAIDSFKLANDRRVANRLQPFSLFISCDVTSFYMDGYTLPLEKRKWYNQFTLQQLINFIKTLALLFPLLLLYSILIGWHSRMFIPAVFSILALVIYAYGLWQLITQKRKTKKRKNTWGIILFQYVDNFLRIRVSAVLQMIKARTKSVTLLAEEIYLKQIRRMYYNSLFSDAKYRDISIASTIYDLSKVNFNTQALPSDLLTPTKELTDVAEKARAMGTTLWFDENHQAAKMKEAIVATGQFTLCYNLIKYLNKMEKANSNGLPVELTTLRTGLLTDWESFKKDPFFLYKQLDR